MSNRLIRLFPSLKRWMQRKSKINMGIKMSLSMRSAAIIYRFMYRCSIMGSLTGNICLAFATAISWCIFLSRTVEKFTAFIVVFSILKRNCICWASVDTSSTVAAISVECCIRAIGCLKRCICDNAAESSCYAFFGNQAF